MLSVASSAPVSLPSVSIAHLQPSVYAASASAKRGFWASACLPSPRSDTTTTGIPRSLICFMASSGACEAAITTSGLSAAICSTFHSASPPGVGRFSMPGNTVVM